MFAISPYQSTLDNYRTEFAPLGGVIDGKRILSIVTETGITNAGLFISDNVITTVAGGSIRCYGEAVVAAPVVIMNAKGSIRLGTDVREKETKPVRVYAPDTLQLTAQKIALGEVRFSACDKLHMLCKVVEVYKGPYFEENVALARRAVVGTAELRIIQPGPPTATAAATGGGSSS